MSLRVTKPIILLLVQGFQDALGLFLVASPKTPLLPSGGIVNVVDALASI